MIDHSNGKPPRRYTPRGLGFPVNPVVFQPVRWFGLGDGECGPHAELVVGGHVAEEHVLACFEVNREIV